jgi:hypothetical protein
MVSVSCDGSSRPAERRFQLENMYFTLLPGGRSNVIHWITHLYTVCAEAFKAARHAVSKALWSAEDVPRLQVEALMISASL